MAPMAYRGSYLCTRVLNLLFMVSRAPKLGSIPRTEAVSVGPSSLQLLLTVLLCPPPPTPPPVWKLGELAFSALDFIQMIKCLCHSSLLPNSKQY